MKSNKALNFFSGMGQSAVSGALTWGTLGAVSGLAINHGHHKRNEKVYHNWGSYAGRAAMWGAGFGAVGGMVSPLLLKAMKGRG